MSIDTAISNATLQAVSEHAARKSVQAAQPAGPNTAVIATIRAHHAALAARLDVLTDAVIAQVGATDPAVGYLAARDVLHDWYRSELLPHAVAEEQALYSEAAELDPSRLLVCGMLAEHRSLVSLIANLAEASTNVEIAAAAAAARAVFSVHVSKENDLLLPALDQAGIDLVAVLDGMHEILGHPDTTAAEDAGCGCGCAHGEEGNDLPHSTLQIGTRSADAPTGPDLDVRTLPHAARHEIIFGRLDLLAPGQTLVLVNDHDPKPLRYQTAAMWPDRFKWNYLEAGPVTWRVAIARVG